MIIHTVALFEMEEFQNSWISIILQKYCFQIFLSIRNSIITIISDLFMTYPCKGLGL